MLLLTFQINEKHYAVRATEVIEILPLTSIKRIARSPNYIAGLLDYRHETIPVVDLVQLTEDRPHQKVLSSRIIIVNYSLGNKNVRIGLIAEKVTDTINVENDSVSESHIKLPNAEYLGKIVNDSGEFIQLVEIKEILNQEVQKLLYQELQTQTLSEQAKN